MTEMEMTEMEICRMYRQAKDRNEQIKILADLNCISEEKILEILLKNGESVRLRLPTGGRKRKKEMTDEEYHKALFRRLDSLDAKIARMEREYRNIVAVLKDAECQGR